MQRAIFSLIFAATISLAANADPHDVFGTWATEAGTSHVTIADCGDGSPCGTVTWIDPEALEPGVTPETAVDANGDNVLGLQMLYDFSKKRNDWRSGTIYDPEAGKTYGSRIKKRDDGTLQVKGCIGPFCQEQIWQPVLETSPATDS